MDPARAAPCRKRSAAVDNLPSFARRPRPQWSSVSARSTPAAPLLGLNPFARALPPCPRCPISSLALGAPPGARGHRDSGLGRNLLSAGLDRAADRSRARLVDGLCHGRLFPGVADGGAGFSAGRVNDRPPLRASPAVARAPPCRAPGPPCLLPP